MAKAFLRDRIASLLSETGALLPGEIASRLGAVPGSVRRELIALRQAGLVRSEGHRYERTTGIPELPESDKPLKEGTVAAELADVLGLRYRSVLEKYTEFASEKRFVRVPVAAEACLQVGQLYELVDASPPSIRSRLSELLLAGKVEKVGDCYKARSLLGRRRSKTVAEVDGWRFRLYRDDTGAEVAIVAPYGQERRRLRYDSRRENYALDLYVVGNAGLGGKFSSAQRAFGNSYGQPLEVVAYPTADFTVVDIDAKRFPKIRQQRGKERVLRVARKSGAIGYEETRGGGLHLIYPTSVEVPGQVRELQDPVYEDISVRRGFYATRPYTLRSLDDDKGSKQRRGRPKKST